jgi:hypothetical protein
MRNMPYGLWYRAERDARRLPPSGPNPILNLFLIAFGGLIVFTAISQGGFGVILGIAIAAGIWQGLTK